MFTGIVEETGRVKKISKSANIVTLEIQAERVLEGAKIGDSISVNGVCLTVVKIFKDALNFEAIPETIKITNLGSLRVSDRVNLERSLKIGDRLSGHFVMGHVDCLGVIRQKKYTGKNLSFEITVPPDFSKYILPKGSIAVDGISLTIAEKHSNNFSVYIIPHTLKETTLSFKGPSEKVNIELDIFAKQACQSKLC